MPCALAKLQFARHTILPADRNPLFDAPDFHKASFVNALGRQNCILFRVAGPHERKQLLKLAVFRVNGRWCCSRLLCILGSLPER